MFHGCDCVGDRLIVPQVDQTVLSTRICKRLPFSRPFEKSDRLYLVRGIPYAHRFQTLYRPSSNSSTTACPTLAGRSSLGRTPIPSAAKAARGLGNLRGSGVGCGPAGLFFLKTCIREWTAVAVRFSFRAISGPARPASNNSRSCLSSRRVHKRPAGREPVIVWPLLRSGSALGFDRERSRRSF